MSHLHLYITSPSFNVHKLELVNEQTDEKVVLHLSTHRSNLENLAEEISELSEGKIEYVE